MKKVQISIFMAVIAWAAMPPTFAATAKPGPGVTASDLSRDLSSVARMAGATEVSRRLITTDLGTGANAPLTEGRAVAILQNAGFGATSTFGYRSRSRFTSA